MDIFFIFSFGVAIGYLVRLTQVRLSESYGDPVSGSGSSSDNNNSNPQSK